MKVCNNYGKTLRVEQIEDFCVLQNKYTWNDFIDGIGDELTTYIDILENFGFYTSVVLDYINEKYAGLSYWEGTTTGKIFDRVGLNGALDILYLCEKELINIGSTGE